MMKLTIDDIRAYDPCYDPSKYLDETWQGTVLDILNDARIPAFDRIWAALHMELLSAKLMRLFAVWCAKKMVSPDADPRSLFALEFAECYAENYDLVDDADYRAMWDAELFAAWTAVQCAPKGAARCAAHSAAFPAAEYAAEYAAWYASMYGGRYDVIQSAQVAKLKELALKGVKTGDTK